MLASTASLQQNVGGGIHVRSESTTTTRSKRINFSLLLTAVFAGCQGSKLGHQKNSPSFSFVGGGAPPWFRYRKLYRNAGCPGPSRLRSCAEAPRTSKEAHSESVSRTGVTVVAHSCTRPSMRCGGVDVDARKKWQEPCALV